MQRRQVLLFLSVLLFSGAWGQDITDPPVQETTTPWNGDQDLCPSGTTTTAAPQKAPPIFDKKAEFAVEVDQELSIEGITITRQISKEQHLFDYDSNRAVVVRNKNNVVATTVYDYNEKLKFDYFAATTCNVSSISPGPYIDGLAPIVLPNGSYHIRPLSEYLLFSFIDYDGKEYFPTYVGQEIHRGITVDVWRNCFVDKSNYQTTRRVWHFAASTVTTNYGPVGNRAVPLHARISISQSLPNGTVAVRNDEVFNIDGYRPGIVEGSDALSIPKGVFCPYPNGSNLVSLEDIGISWPRFFSVRVEATSSRSSRWERFHLSFASGRRGDLPFVRYDFLPEGDENYRSVIHDNAQKLTYTIDERRGTCYISRYLDDQYYSPIRNPIEFFIKYGEDLFLYPSPVKAWSLNAFRTCRTGGVQCAIATTSVDLFPPMVDSDTGFPTGETWTVTNIEYAWGKRAPLVPPRPNATRIFDYPVSLYLKMFQVPGRFAPSATQLRVEDVEYEFFDMGTDISPYVFDISNCYRSNNFEYIHLFFKLEADRPGVLDTPMFNRRDFQFELTRRLAETAQISYIRISEMDFDHERVEDVLNIFFTILGQTYIPETQGFNTTEPSAATARQSLEQAINAGTFTFDFMSERVLIAKFTGRSDSLQLASSYITTQITEFNETRIEYVTDTITDYSGGAQATGIIVGFLIGLIVGGILAFVIYKVRGGGPISAPSFSNPRQTTVGFTNTKPSTEASKA